MVDAIFAITNSLTLSSSINQLRQYVGYTTGAVFMICFPPHYTYVHQR